MARGRDRWGAWVASVHFNQAKDRPVPLAFPTKELPYLTLWKNANAPEEGYVTGIEPGTSFPYNRRIERGRGRVPKLAAGRVAVVQDRSSGCTWGRSRWGSRLPGASRRFRGDGRKIQEAPQVQP